MTRRSKPRAESFECPHCGADVPIGSRACRECGSDAGTGWQGSEEVDYQSVDLPEEDAGPAAHAAAGGRPRWIVVAALAAAAALAAWAVFGGR